MIVVYFLLNRLKAVCRLLGFFCCCGLYKLCPTVVAFDQKGSGGSSLCQPPRNAHMRIPFSFRPRGSGCGSWWLCYKGSLRSAWALLVHYSCIPFERGQDWQELIAWWYTFICLFDVQIMFSYYFALWRPVMPPASSPGLWLVLRLLLVQCVVWLHHPCTMDITFLALLLLLIGCWAPVQVKPLVSEPRLILIVELFVSRIID